MIRRLHLNLLLAGLVLSAFSGAAHAAEKVKVFILAGQSNMEGKAKMSLVEYQATAPKTAEFFKPFRKDDKWVQRDDVFIKFLDRKGKLTVGFGSPNCVGPELQFGWTVGDRYKEPVLLIKTAWGGRSLFRDFRPPSAGLPADEVLAKELEQNLKRDPKATIEQVKARYGQAYREMMMDVKATLANLKDYVPGYEGQGYEILGFAWFQGWNDMINAEYTAAYADNMAKFIRDVRKDLDQPKLPFAIGQMGVDGLNANANVKRFKDAQAAAAELAEFKGNVALVKTDVFWDTEAETVFKKGWRENVAEWNTVGSDYAYHYYGSAKTYCKIGGALAKALIDLGAPSR